MTSLIGVSAKSFCNRGASFGLMDLSAFSHSSRTSRDSLVLSLMRTSTDRIIPEGKPASARTSLDCSDMNCRKCVCAPYRQLLASHGKLKVSCGNHNLGIPIHGSQ